LTTNLGALRADLDRFAFLLGGNDGEFLSATTRPDPARPRSSLTSKPGGCAAHRGQNPRATAVNTHGQNQSHGGTLLTSFWNGQPAIGH